LENKLFGNKDKKMEKKAWLRSSNQQKKAQDL
jgi:hypothetical protein